MAVSEEQRHNHIATRGRRRSRSPAEVEWLCSESTPTRETSCYADCEQLGTSYVEERRKCCA